MIRLLSLSLNHFRSFVGLNTVHIPHSGLILIEGFNKDTSGSSGAGKSCVLEGLAYLLGGSSLTAASIQSWHSDQKPTVIGEFDVDGKKVILSRGSSISIEVDGVRSSGSSKKVGEIWRRVTGVPLDVAIFLTYRPQRTGGAFLGLDDASKKEFLGEILGLNSVERSWQESVERARVAEANLSGTQRECLLVQSRLDDLASRTPDPDLYSHDLQRALARSLEVKRGLDVDLVALSSLSDFDLPEIERDLSVLNSTIVSKQNQAKTEAIRNNNPPKLEAVDAEIYEYEQSLVDIETKRKGLEVSFQSLVVELEAELDTLSKAQVKRDSQKATLLGFLGKIDGFRDKKRVLDERLALLDTQLCPECLQALPGSDPGKREALLSEIAKVQGSIDTEPELKEALDRLESLSSSSQQQELSQQIKNVRSNHQKSLQQLSSLRLEVLSLLENAKDRRSKIQGQANKLLAEQIADIHRAVFEEFRPQLLELEDRRKNTLAEISRYRASIAEAQKDLEREKQAVSELTIKDTTQKELFRSNQEDMELARAQLKSLTTQYEQELAQINLDLDFSDMIGKQGFLGKIFDELLAQISIETNKILSLLPNVAHVSIELSSQKTLKSGKEAPKIVAKLKFGGNEGDLKSAASGGMKSSIDLAVDLAIIKIIEQRTQKRFGWLALDEAFEGLDHATISPLLELIGAMAQDKCVLFVEHKSEAKECATGSIEIVFENGISSIRSKHG